MSRRYGRNQKRRAREALANAMQYGERFRIAWQRETELLKDIAAKKRHLEEVLNDIREALPEGSALLPPGSLATGMRPDPHTPILVAPVDLNIFKPHDPNARTFTPTELRTLVCSIDPEHFSGKLHFNVQFMDKEFRYAISPGALYAMPRDRLRDILRDDIARQFARELVDALRPQQPRARHA